MPESRRFNPREEPVLGRPLRALALRETAIVVASAACAITVATGWHSPVRTTLAIIFLLLIPGLSVAELLEVDDIVFRLTVGIGVSLAADSAVSLCLFYAHAWSVGRALAILLALTAGALAVAALRAWRGRTRDLAG